MSKNKNVRPWHMFESRLENSRRVDDDVASARLDICRSCPSFIALTTTCKECGCVMKLKTKLKNASCPLDKWSAE
jgi:hypothetical protein